MKDIIAGLSQAQHIPSIPIPARLFPLFIATDCHQRSRNAEDHQQLAKNSVCIPVYRSKAGFPNKNQLNNAGTRKPTRNALQTSITQCVFFLKLLAAGMNTRLLAKKRERKKKQVSSFRVCAHNVPR